MDYKKYSLEKLQEWIHDSLSCGEASPHEIYSAIREAVREDYYCYKDYTSRAYGLLELLSGHRPVENKSTFACDKDDKSSECQQAWNNFWEENYYPEEYQNHNENVKDYCMPPWGHSDMEALRYTEEELNAMCDNSSKKDKVVKWQLPVEIDGLSGEYYINLPDDLMEAANIKENDMVEWVEQGDGSYLLKKVDG